MKWFTRGGGQNQETGQRVLFSEAREFPLVRLSWLLSYSQHVFWMDTDLWTILTQCSPFLVAEDQTDWDIYTYKVFVFISSRKMWEGQLEYPQF